LDQELLLLVSLLYFLPLLLKHFSIVLGNVGGDGKRHDDIKAKEKVLFSVYILLI